MLNKQNRHPTMKIGNITSCLIKRMLCNTVGQRKGKFLELKK